MLCLFDLAIIRAMNGVSKSRTRQLIIRALVTLFTALALATSIFLTKSPLSAQSMSDAELIELAASSIQKLKRVDIAKAKLSLSVPSDWVIKESKPPYLFEAATADGIANTHVTVGTTNLKSSEEFAKEVLSLYSKDSDIRIENCMDKEVLVSDSKAILRRQIMVLKQTRIQQLNCYIVKDGKAYGFSATTNEHDGKFLMPLFEKIASSLRIGETKSPSSSPTPSSPTAISSSARIRDKWALVVGISQFQDKRIPSLKYAAKDARDFRDFLVKEANFAPDHVRLLLNEKATERQVVSELGNKFLARVAKEGDLIVLYFSTHGSPSKADLKGKNYLVAYDSDRDDLYATGIEMQKIVETLNDRVDSTRTLLVLDACHSGATSAGTKGMEDPSNFSAEDLAQGSGKLVICSSSQDQKSWESTRYQNGIFTRKLIEGLRMNGKKTKLGDAFGFVLKSVKSEVQEDQATKQEPVLRSKWDGNDLTLAVPPAEPQALPQSVRALLGPDSSQMVHPNTTPVKRPQHK